MYTATCILIINLLSYAVVMYEWRLTVVAEFDVVKALAARFMADILMDDVMT